MEHAFSLGKEQDCAVQLHTESVGEPELRDIAERANKTGIKMYRVVKHYSPPLVKTCEELGIFPGVISVKGAIEQAIEEGTRFMMETDYIDDPDRPGAVLGPKTILKRTIKLVEIYGEEPFWIIHKENPEKVYDIEIEL
jgi:TatD-related deoxyribonuclease